MLRFAGPRTTILGALSLSMLVSTAASGQNLSDRIAEVARQREAAAAKDNSQAALLGALLYTDISVDFATGPNAVGPGGECRVAATGAQYQSE